jgi:hypothetical protein
MKRDMYLTATPAGAASCARCFRGEDHQHVAELDIRLALDRAAALVSPGYVEMVGERIAAENRQTIHMAKALLALHSDLCELARWVKTT